MTRMIRVIDIDAIQCAANAGQKESMVIAFMRIYFRSTSLHSGKTPISVWFQDFRMLCLTKRQGRIRGNGPILGFAIAKVRWNDQ